MEKRLTKPFKMAGDPTPAMYEKLQRLENILEGFDVDNLWEELHLLEELKNCIYFKDGKPYFKKHFNNADYVRELLTLTKSQRKQLDEAREFFDEEMNRRFKGDARYDYAIELHTDNTYIIWVKNFETNKYLAYEEGIKDIAEFDISWFVDNELDPIWDEEDE